MRNQFTSYEEYADFVQKIELAEARRRLAAGDDIKIVMEVMSHRMQKKLLHPIILAIKESNNTVFDPVKSREDYAKAFAERGPVADHVTTDY